MRKFAIAFVLVCMVPAVYAQEGRRGAAPFVRAGVEPETLKGAPYSADVISESVQVFSDGNRIVNRTTSRVYRDSEGRTRREIDRPVQMEVSISDPVAGRSSTLNLDARTARQNPLAFSTYNLTLAGADLEKITVLLNDLQTSARVGPNGRGWIVRPGDQSTEENLAPRTIEGLRVEGIRRTSTIAAGKIGNERPIVVTSEEWTSPDLRVLVLSESNDPRTGTSTYKLVNVKRGDPPASLFQVPSDFTIVQGPAGGRGGRNPAPQPAPR